MTRALLVVVLGFVAVSATAAETLQYSYDAKGRLVVVEQSGVTPEPRTTSYDYDASDNRQRVTVCGVNSSDLDGRRSVGETAALYQWDRLESPDGRFRLILQNDGHLVLYQLPGTPLWANGVIRSDVCRIVLENTGNLVVYSRANIMLWQSNTANQGASRLVLQNDGNLVIYRRSDGAAVWSTGTYGH